MKYLLAFALFPSVLLSQTLLLEDYLKQVREKHLGFKGAYQNYQALQQRAGESSLIRAFTLDAVAQWAKDSSPVVNTAFQGAERRADGYSLGISKQTSLGLRARLTYNINYTSLLGVNTDFITMPSFYDAKPAVEITQPLLRNFLGRETNAMVDSQAEEMLMRSYVERAKARQYLLEAELAYLRLTVARQISHIQEEALERSKKISDWAKSRWKSDLADQGDFLQAQAAYELKSLELKMSQDEIRLAENAIKTFIPDAGAELGNLEDISNLQKSRAGYKQVKVDRDDVLAAEHDALASQARAQVVRERNLPNLEVFGSAALTARQNTFDSAVSRSFNNEFPTYGIGVRLNMPLDFGTMSGDRAAAAKEQEAANMAFENKKREQERDWNEIQEKFKTTLQRLELHKKIENAQKEKLLREKSRHQKGRTTTFQVVMFEQDFSNAQVQRVKVEQEFVAITAQLRLYGEFK